MNYTNLINIHIKIHLSQTGGNSIREVKSPSGKGIWPGMVAFQEREIGHLLADGGQSLSEVQRAFIRRKGEQ